MSDESHTFDVVVIGAGVVGCAIADALGARGLHVALVERAGVGRGTSASSFAWINATAKAADEAYHRLNALGAQRYRELARECGEAQIGLHQCGQLEWSSPSDPARLEDLRARVRQLEAWDYKIGWVARERLEAMEPHVRFEDGAEGLHAMTDAWLDVPVFLSFLVERLRANRGRVFERCAARELVMTDAGRVEGLDTQAGRLTTGTVVLATGPDTPDVLSTLTKYEAFATRFPVRRVPGLLVETPPGEIRALTRHVLYSADLHVREASGGGLLLGADDTDGEITEEGSGERVQNAARQLLERARRLIPSFEGPSMLERCRLSVGVRAMPADGRSIVGPMPFAQGLHIAVTHSGVTLSLVLGELVADTIETGTLAPALEPFGLARFQAIG